MRDLGVPPARAVKIGAEKSSHRTRIPISPRGPMEECDTDPHQVPNSDILGGKEETEFKTGSQKDPGALDLSFSEHLIRHGSQTNAT